MQLILCCAQKSELYIETKLMVKKDEFFLLFAICIKYIKTDKKREMHKNFNQVYPCAQKEKISCCCSERRGLYSLF